MSSVALKLKLESMSATATAFAVVTALVGLVVGLGIINSTQEGLLVALTTSGLGVVGLIANSIHSGLIEPSALVAAVMSVVVQAVALAVSFLWISQTTAAHVVVIVSAVVLAVAQVAHALLSRQATV
jgi:hypothetical protein